MVPITAPENLKSGKHPDGNTLEHMQVQRSLSKDATTQLLTYSTSPRPKLCLARLCIGGHLQAQPHATQARGVQNQGLSAGLTGHIIGSP